MSYLNSILDKYNTSGVQTAPAAPVTPTPTPKPVQSTVAAPKPAPAPIPTPTPVQEPKPVSAPSYLGAFKKLKVGTELNNEEKFVDKLFAKIKVLSEMDVETMMKDSFSDDGDNTFSFDYNGYNFTIECDSNDGQSKITIGGDELADEYEQWFEYRDAPAFFQVMDKKIIEHAYVDARTDFEILQNIERNLGTKITHYYSDHINYENENSIHWYTYSLQTTSPQSKYICVRDTDNNNAYISDFQYMELYFTNIEPARADFDPDKHSHYQFAVEKSDIPQWRIAKKIIDYIANDDNKAKYAADAAHEKLMEIMDNDIDRRRHFVHSGMRQM